MTATVQVHPGRPRHASGTDRGMPVWVVPVLAGAALVCWLLGLRGVDPTALTGLGLISVLSPAVVAAYPLLLAAGLLELAGRGRTWMLTLLTLLLLVMVYGLQPIVEEQARLPVGWLHVGFADHINRTGELLSGFDTRFSWPGFFTFVAFLGQAAGLEDTAPFLRWAPVVLTGLAALAVRALAGAVFRTTRPAWLATWIFLAANWSEQDYFSPQGVAFVLLVSALAVVARFLATPDLLDRGRPAAADRTVPDATVRQRIGAHLFLLLISTALAASHQLTPFVLGGILLVLAWSRRVSWTLPLTALLPPVVWFVLGGRDFWISQLELITGSIGDLSGSVDAGITARLAGDPGHEFVVKLRIALTGLVLLGGLLGWWLRRRQGSRSWLLPVLMMSSFGLAVLQPYGGEVFVRCFLFSLPWAAIGTAMLLDRAFSARGVVMVGRWLAVSLLVLSTVTVRGGNDAYTSITTADTKAMEWIYQHTTPGDRVVALTWYAPLRWQQVADVPQLSIEEHDLLTGPPCAPTDDDLQCLLTKRPEFVVVNPQQDAAGVILDGRQPGWTDDLRTRLTESGYRIGFQEGDVVVLTTPEVLP